MSVRRVRSGRPRTALALATVLVAGLSAGLSGCSPDEQPPAADASGQQASPTSGSSPTSRTTVSLEDSPCRLKGFVPRHTIVLRSQRRTLLYAAGLTLSPGVVVSGADRLQRITDVNPGVRVISPDGASVDPGVLRSVGSMVKHSSPAPLPGEFFIRRRVAQDPGSPGLGHYGEYVSAKVYRGTWSARLCGGLTNDGASATVVRGSFTTIGPTDSGVIPCERVTGSRPEWVRRLADACE